MIYRRLGGSGLKVSLFSLGSWTTFGENVDDRIARACVRAAFEAGVNFFDNAEAYGGGQAEIVMGGILREMPREDLVISSKVFWGGEGPNDVGLSRKHVMEACHAALRRLQVEYLDLYFCHRPDPDTPIYETVHAMDVLIRQGKVLYWGTSEWSAAQIRAAYAVARQHNLVPPTCEQPQYNLLAREKVEGELHALCVEEGLGLTTWSPLSSGVLTGKYNDEVPEDARLGQASLDWLRDILVTPENIAKVRRLAPIAEGLDCSLAQLALAWTAHNPDVSTVITGATRPQQIEQNLAALELIPKLTPEILAAIDAAVAG